MNRWLRLILFIVLSGTLVYDLLIRIHSASGHWWDAVPGYFIIFGLVGSLASVYFAKFCGHHFLQKKVDYYED